MMKTIIVLITMLLLPFVAEAENRLALVIGNSNYHDAPRLVNPVHDATDIAAALTRLGFTVSLLTDANREQMGRAIDAFGEKLTADRGVGLFFYAGHGMQVKGNNYLIPVSSGIKGETDVKYRAIDAGEVLGKMEAAGNPTNLVFLDACRNNPFARSFRSGSQGLAQMSAPTGSLVAYATAPGSVAADGKDRNGVFTKHLLAQMETRGLSVSSMLMKVRTGVLKDTGKKQTPWDSSSLTGDFYFVPPSAPMPRLDHNLPNAPPSDDLGFDQLAKEQQRRSQWGLWQAKMQRNFDRVAALSADADLQVKAWDMFLSGYGQNNPLSQEDERLRQTAQSRKKAAEIELAQAKITILPYTPPQPAGRVAGTEQVFDGITFVWIPSGSFMMGSPITEAKRYSDEKQHPVTIAQGFWLGKYEVTQTQWQAVMGKSENRSHFKGDNRPVENVSWNDIQPYLTKLGSDYRLPTEAEWEYAARAGTTTPFATGSCISTDQANYNGNHPYSGCAKGEYREQTLPVGSLAKNDWGLYDMHGNVWEWTSSLYKKSYDGSELTDSPSSNKGARSLRGGSWSGGAWNLRAANRFDTTPSFRFNFMGFRLARVGSLGQDR